VYNAKTLSRSATPRYVC